MKLCLKDGSRMLNMLFRNVKNHNLVLFLILAKLFNCCEKEKCFPNLWKVSAHPSLQYHHIILLNVIIKPFVAITNQQVLHIFQKTTCDNSIGFAPLAYVLTVFTPRNSEALNDRAIALGILKAFDKMYYTGLLHKLCT